MKSVIRLEALCAGIAALMGIGCARYQAKPIVAEQTAAAFESRSLNDTGLREFLERTSPEPLPVWPPSTWELTNLTLAAFYFHPDLDVARAKWATAQAGRTAARERPNPTLSVAPAFNTSTSSPSPWLVTAVLDIPIETAGKRGYRVDQALHLSEAAQLQVASVAWQVRSRLRHSLLLFYATGQMRILLQQQQAVQGEILQRLDAQFALGAVSAFEVTQARIALDNIRLALHDAERQHGEARVQLASALGLPVNALEGVSFSFGELTEPPPVPPADLRRQALLNRADILSALAEYAASESALHLQVARQYPDIHFNPGYEFDQGDNKWSLGLSLTLPVLNQNQGMIAEADAHRTELAAEFIALQARVLAEIDTAVAAYRAAVAKAATADELLQNSRKQGRTVAGAVQAGDTPRLALFTTELELKNIMIARLNAHIAAQQALGQLEDALQSPIGLSDALWLVSPRTPALPEGVIHE